ncbi:hypothetical protein, partial [Micromonospora echinofusca]
PPPLRDPGGPTATRHLSVAASLDFLDSRKVDTTEYPQRALTVRNAGAINTGSGTINVGRDAVGRIDPSGGSQPGGRR